MLCSLCVNHIGAEGASALAAVLKETRISTLKCAAAPKCSLLCQRPLTRTQHSVAAHLSTLPATLLASQHAALCTAWLQQHHGRRRRPSRQSGAGSRRMTDFCGIPLASLRENSITELNLGEEASAMPGAIVLSKLLPSRRRSPRSSRRPECSLLCQRPLTHLLSHCFPTAPCSQSLPEQHRRRRRLRTRRHPQGDEDHQPQVRRRPRVFAFVSAPADTHLPSHCAPTHPL